jgi:hypothetical protein
MLLEKPPLLFLINKKKIGSKKLYYSSKKSAWKNFAMKQIMIKLLENFSNVIMSSKKYRYG